MSTAPIGTSADTPKDVDGRGVWPLWFRQQEWRGKVEEQATRKALDLPMDDMHINQQGISAKGAMGIAAIAGLPPALLAGAMLMGYGKSDANASANVSAPATAASPADSEYEVIFYDADGNRIHVPHVSELPK